MPNICLAIVETINNERLDMPILTLKRNTLCIIYKATCYPFYIQKTRTTTFRSSVAIQTRSNFIQ